MIRPWPASLAAEMGLIGWSSQDLVSYNKGTVERC